MKEFIEYVIKQLVDNPDDVHVAETIGAHTAIYELRVGTGDMGKVIGKRGQNANSLRTILAAVAGKQGRRSVLEILEGNEIKKNPGNELHAKAIDLNSVLETHLKDERRWQDDGGNNLGT